MIAVDAASLQALPPANRAWMLPVLEAMRDRAAPRLELGDGTIALVVAPASVIPQYGMGPHTRDTGIAQVAIDPASPRLADPDRDHRLASLIAHELYRLARFRHPAGGWSPSHRAPVSLGHSLLCVGLAQAFVEEMGLPCPPWSIAVEREPLWDLGTRAMASFETTDFDRHAWFSGRPGDAAFPRFGGQSLGYAIVRSWMMLTETTPSEEIGLEPAEVLRAWRTGQLDI